MRPLQLVFILALAFFLSTKENEARLQKSPESATINRVPVPSSGSNPFSYVPPNPRPSARAMPIPTKNPKRANENILNKGKEWIKQDFPEYTTNRADVPPSGSNPFSYVPRNPRPSTKRAASVTNTKPIIAGEKLLNEGKEWLKKTFAESNTINKARVPPTGSNPFSYVPPNPRSSVKTGKPVATRKQNIAGEKVLNNGDEWVKQGFPEYTINRARVPPSGPNPFSYVPPNPQTSEKSSTATKAEKDTEKVLSKGKEWMKRKFPDSRTKNRARVPPSGSNPFSYVPPNPRTSVKRATTKLGVHGEISSNEGKMRKKHIIHDHRY